MGLCIAIVRCSLYAATIEGFIRWLEGGSSRYDTILDVGCILAVRHPDALFEHHAIDAAQAIGKDGEPLFKAKCLKMRKARRIERSFSIFIGTKIVGTLIKRDLFIDLGQ